MLCWVTALHISQTNLWICVLPKQFQTSVKSSVLCYCIVYTRTFPNVELNLYGKLFTWNPLLIVTPCIHVRVKISTNYRGYLFWGLETLKHHCLGTMPKGNTWILTCKFFLRQKFCILRDLLTSQTLIQKHNFLCFNCCFTQSAYSWINMRALKTCKRNIFQENEAPRR